MKGASSLILLILIIAAAVVLSPVMVVVVSAESGQAPPLSQPLVREGTLATELAGALKLGPAANEAEAESVLSAAGIAPRNGWIADYPVTPDIVGELQASVSEAADAGRITLTKDAAVQAFGDVLASYGLTVAPGTSTPSENETAAAPDYPDAGVVESYYYEEGPPVVTYYAPPPHYAYLYSWVPYPFWWWDVWFPGFFVLADFNIGFHGHGHHHHDGHGHRHGDRDFVSNHFRDPRTGDMLRIDPANRAHGRTFSDRAFSENTGSRGWKNPSVRSSAQSIVSKHRAFTSASRRSMTAAPPADVMASPPSRKPASVSTAGPAARKGAAIGAPARTFGGSDITGRRSFTRSTDRAPRMSAPSSGQGRTFSQPAYRTPGNFTPSTGGRSFTAPSGGSRSFSAPVRSGGGSIDGMRGSFSGRGGGSFRGGKR